MRNKILFFVMIVLMATIAGCKIGPDDPSDYDVKFLKGEMLHVVVEFPVELEPGDELLPEYLDKDETELFSAKALLTFKDNSISELVAFCVSEDVDDGKNGKCTIFLPAALIDIKENFKLKIIFTATEELCDALIDADFACNYATPELDVPVVSITSKIPYGIITGYEVKNAAALSKEHLDIIRHANIDTICDANPEVCGFKDADVDGDNEKWEDILVIDGEKGVEPEGQSLLGEGGACTMLPGAEGSGLVGAILMIFALAPMALRRKPK